MLNKVLGDPLIGAEIGTAYGSMVIALLAKFPLLHMYAIDPFVPYDPKDSMSMPQKRMDEVYEFTRNRLLGTRAELIRNTSINTAATFKDYSLDFAFIDAVHQYEPCCADIRAWWPKIRSGGLLTGHDYCTYWNGVQKAVNEFAVEMKLPLLVWNDIEEPPIRHATIWAIQKP
jgi:hypothetical protein